MKKRVKSAKRSRAKAKPKSRLDSAIPVADIETGMTSVFYGRPGSGKTATAGTFPVPHLMLDIGEHGTSSVKTTPGIVALKVIDWEDFEAIFWEIKENPDAWETVTIDAAHAVQLMALTKAQKDNNKGEADALSLRDRNIATEMMITWFTNYRDLEEDGINVNFLAHDRVIKEDTDDDQDGQISPEVIPKLMPVIAGVLLGLTGINGHTFIREDKIASKVAGEPDTVKTKYCMRLGPNAYYATKVRSPVEFIVPPYIVNPSYKKLRALMAGKDLDADNKVKSKKLRRGKR